MTGLAVMAILAIACAAKRFPFNVPSVARGSKHFPPPAATTMPLFDSSSTLIRKTLQKLSVVTVWLLIVR